MALAHPATEEPAPGFVGVPLLRWPTERAKAQRLEDQSLPYLLLVGAGEAPPLSGYRWMDWVRSPVDPNELIARRSNLEERFVRSQEGPRPALDPDTGRLTFGREAVDLSAAQVPVIEMLLARYRDVVPDVYVCAVFGVTETRSEVLTNRLVRLRRRVRSVGLDIVRVPRLGYSLAPSSKH